MKSFLFSLCLTLIAMGSIAQTDYYVSLNGNDDGTGLMGDPWQTVQHAMDNATPGSTVNIYGGTYNEKVYLNVSGTNGNWITFKNFGNDDVIIDGTGLNDPAICEIYDQQYIRLQGLHFKNNIQLDAMGIFIEGMCHHIEIIECKVSDIHFSADPNAPINETTNAQPLIVYGNLAESPVTDLLILDCEIFNSRTGYSEALAVNGNVDGFEISGNSVYNISNIGIDAIGHEGTCPNPDLDQARNGYIDWNIVYNCQSPYASSAGIYIDGARDIYIENNIVYDNQWGIEVGCENLGKTASGIVVRNNFIYGNTSGGIQLGGYDYPNGSGKVTDCMVVNNTTFNNSVINYYDGELTLTYSENCTIVNNIFYATNPEVQLISLEDVVSIPPGLVLDHNLWYHADGSTNVYIYWNGTDYDSFESFTTGTGFEVNSQFADPVFQSDDVSDPDLHLKTDSPAISAANTMYLSHAGDKDIDDENRVNEDMDKGADEYYASSGLFSQISNNTFNVYPNPASDIIFLDYESINADFDFVEILDLNGKVFKKLTELPGSGITVNSLPSGVYLVRFSVNNKIGFTKFIVE